MAPSGTEVTTNEGTRTVIQEGIREKDRHMASVTLLDGQRLDVQVHKNAEGEILFNLVCNSIELIEKDYFSLAFYDQNSTRKWLYKNKKISKQIKDLPWEFTLEVKFYTPEPQDLREDFTRHLLTLQLRADLYNGKLPAAFANQARFGSLIAQAELGDYKPELSYKDALRALNIVKHMTPELSDAICQFYKDQKGKTPPEAELSFLLACRENSMYGMSIYNAKERGQPVRIGINAHGIGVFTEQLRTHYVVWQSMHQLEYQRKSFTIKLKPGEKEGKNNLVFKLDDEGSAKRCWKTAVDHHTFFRLLQPADKHNSLFSFGSTRRPEGRTLIQAKMASQMFDGTPAAPQMSSARVVSRSPENPTYQAASPVEEGRVIMESTTTRTYHIETREATSPRSDAFDGTTDEVGEISVSPDAPPRHALHASDKPLFVSTAASEHLDGTRTSSRCYTITESLSLPQQQFSPSQQSMQQSIKFGTENEARLLQRGNNLPTSFSTTPTLLSSAWFAKQRQRRLLTMSSAQPTPTSEVRSPVDSAQFTTVVTSPIPRSTTQSPYSHLIQTPDPGEQLLPIVREINQQMTTTLMSLPSRSHTVLAEYLSTADTSHLSNELIAAYRSLLTACGDTPAQADLKIREATSTRVYCRRSPLSPLTLNTPLPADVEDVLRTRSPSPTVRFDETVNHCIRITGVDNNASLYQYNVSAAEASRAKIRGGYSPNRQAYTSLTREEANIKTTDYTTPKRKLFGRRKQKSSPFVRNEFAPTVGMSRQFDVQEVPLRYHSAVYHSGYSTRFPYLSERDRFAGDEEVAEVSAENEQKYPLIGEASGSAERLEKLEELDGRNLRQYVRVYYRDKQHRGFSKPTAILHMRHQQRQRDQHTHKNGHAQIDLSPVPRYEPLAVGENENQKIRRYRIFTRERHEGIEQIIEEVDLSAYPTLQEPGQQEEPVETLEKVVDVDIQPLMEHTTAYHSGESYTPSEQIPRSVTEETSTPRSKQTAVLHLKKKREEKAKKTKTKREFFKRKQEKTFADDDLQSPSTSNPPISEPYEGSYDTVNPDEQLTSLPLRSHVQPYHSGYSITSTNRRYRFFTRERHPGEEETIEPDVDRYNLDSTEFDGPLETVAIDDRELQKAPLKQHSNVYHSGHSFVRTKQVGKKKVAVDSSSESGFEEEAEDTHGKRTARLVVRSEVVEQPEVSTEKKPLFGFLRGGKKTQQNEQATYPSTTERYEGELEDVPKTSELVSSPLRENVDVVHKIKYKQPARKQKSEVNEELAANKKTAQLHVKSEVTEIPDEKIEERKPLFGFLKGKKDVLPPTSYLTTEVWEGELSPLNKNDELDGQPIRDHVDQFYDVFYSASPRVSETTKEKSKLVIHTKSTITEEPEDKTPSKDSEKHHLFGFLHKNRHGKSEEQSPTQSTAYPSIGEKWDGEFEKVERTKDIDNLPILSQVERVHDAAYHFLAGDGHKTEPSTSAEVEEEQRQRTAVIHAKTTIIEEDQSQKPKEDRHSSFFGFRRGKKEHVTEEHTKSSYPTSGPYNGELDNLPQTEELNISPIREHVDQINEVAYSPLIKSKQKADDRQSTDEAQKQSALIHAKTTIDESPEKESPTEEHRGKLFGFLKTKKHTDEKMSPVSSYPELSEKYEGDYIALTPTEFSTIPLREIVEVVHDVPYTLKKKPQTPAGYPTISERYEGHYDHLQPHEFDRTPISDSVDEIHDVPYSAKKDDHSQYPQIGERYEGELDLLQANEVDGLPLRESVDQVHDVAYETEVHKTALIHAKTTDVEVIDDEENESPKTGKRKLFGFLSGKKEHHDEKMSPVSSYPELGERFEGVYEELNPTEFVTLPLRETVETVHDVPYSLKKEERSRYPPIGEKFEGEHDLLESTELDSSPLKEHVDRIHDIENLQPTKIEEVETHKTAVIHAKSTVVEVSEDSKSEGKSKRSGLFRGKKAKTVKEEDQRSKSHYPSIGEKYEGVLDVLEPTEITTSPLRPLVDVYDVSYEKTPKVVVTDEATTPIEQEHKQTAVIYAKSTVVENVEVPKLKKSRKKKKDSSSYPQMGEVYIGEHDVLHPTELEDNPLKSFVEQIHDVSYPRSAKVEKNEVQQTEEPKQTARIVMKSTTTEFVDTPKPKESKLFGFLKTKKERTTEDEHPIVYPTSPPFEGPYDTVNPDEQLTSLPLRSHVQPYHSGYSITSTNRRYRFFTRERHPGEEETIEPDVDRYNLDSTEFDGPLETVAIDDRELQKAPLKQHSNVYHSGHSFVRTKQVGKKKVAVDSSSESGFEEEAEDTHGKRTARLVVRSEVVEQPEVSTEKKPLFGFLRSGKKTQQNEQATYPSTTERYEGELEDVPKTSELVSSPLRENVDVVHEIAELPQQPKKVAQLHIKSAIIEVPEEEHKPLFGFLKKHPKKEEEKPSVSPLPTTTERYEGPLESLSTEEFDSTPLTDYVDQIIEVDYPSPKRSPKVIKKEPTDEVEESKKIAQLHVKSEEVEVREVEERKPLFGFLRGKKEHDEKMSPVSSYPELSEKYEGDYIALTPTEFSTIPLREIVEVVHDVPYTLKKKPQTPAGYPTISERYEGDYDHLQPHEFDRIPISDSVDEFHDVPYSAKKDDHSQYPQIGERYEGEHDLLESNEFDASPLRDHVDKIHDVSHSPVSSPHKVAEEVIDEHKATAQVHVKSEVVEEVDTEGRRKSQLFGFLHGKKQHHEEASRYPTIGEKFEGQPDILNNEEFTSSPIESHVDQTQEAVHPQIQEVEVETPTDKTYGKTAVIHMKSTVVEVPEDEKDVNKSKLFGFLRGKKEQTRKTEESQPSIYPPISEVYEGDVDVLTKPDELPQNVLRNNVNLYHDDLLYAPQDSTKSDERKQTMRLVVKSEDYQHPEVKEESQSMFGFLRGMKKTRDLRQPSTSYPSLTERYDGELSELPKTSELSVTPIHEHVEVIHDVLTKSKLRIPKIEITDESETAKKTAQLHIKSEVFEVPEKEERVSTIEGKKHRYDKEDDQTADLSKYPQVLEAWEGDYDTAHKLDELDSSPLREHVEQIHNLAYPKSTNVPQEVGSTKAPTHKATAIIRTRSTVVEAPESKSSQKQSPSKLFGFLRNKTDESNTIDYPVQEKWEGEIELLDRPEELNKTAINDHTTVYHSGSYKRLPNKSVEATEVVEPKQTARLVVKSEDVEVAEAPTHEDKSKSLFGFLKSKKEDAFYSSHLEPYTGELGSLTKTDELIPTPLKEHVDYIAEVPYISEAKEVSVEDVKQRKTAVIHTKTTLNDEPTESSTDGKSKLFGFWSGKKQPKDEEKSSYSSYPIIGERWEGEVHPEHRVVDFIHSPILEHVENVGEIPPYTTVTQITSEQTIVTEGDERRTLTVHTTSTIVETTEPKSKDSEQHKRFGFLRGHRQSKTDELPSSFYPPTEPYTGDYETTERVDDLENRPLRDSAQVYHSGFSPQNNKRYRLFFYERHAGEEELVEKVDEKYNFDRTLYEGLFDEMIPNAELESTTIREYSDVYHHGSSFEQKPRSARRKEVEVSSESEDEESRPKSSAHLTVKSKEYEELEVEQPKEETEHKLFGFIRGNKKDERPSAYPTADKWEGPVDDIVKLSEIEVTPLRSHVNVYEFSYSPVNLRQKKKPSVTSEDDGNRKKTAAITTKSTVTEEVEDQHESSPSKLFGFRRKKEQRAETEHSKSKYPSISEAYNGELDVISKPDELLDSPIREHVDIIHDVKYKSTTPSPQPTKTEVVEEPRSNKKIAQLHVKSEVVEVPESEVTPERKPLFGFLRKQHHDKQQESELISPTSDYPTSEQWEGEIETVSKDTELPEAQLRDHANAYFDGSYSTTRSEVAQPKQAARLFVKSEVVELPEDKHSSTNRKPFFGFRQQKKEVDSQQSKYPAIEEQWNGKPEALNVDEFDASPLREHVELIHTTDYPDKSPTQKVDVTKEEPKQTARIVMKSTTTEFVDTPKPKESKLFGFLKTKKERTTEDEHPIVYPTSPPFEGPYDTVNPDEQLTSLPLRSHVQPYHSGYSITSTNRRYRFFTRERHPGEEETIEPDVDRYNLDSTEFDGPLETVAIDDRELQKAPLKQHSNVYHSGHSFVRTKQVGKKKVAVDSSSESGFEEEAEDTHGKRTARLVVRSEVVEQPEVSTEKKPLFGFLRGGKKTQQNEQATYPSTTERYEGELEDVPKTSELVSSPLRENVDVVHELAELPQQPKKVAQLHIKSAIIEVPEEEHKPLFGFLKKHPKKEEEKPSVSPLPATTERYEGPLESLSTEEFDTTPLTDYVDQIIEVDYPSPKRSPKVIKKEPTDEVEESKKIAQLHVKSEEVEVREVEERKPLFGFLRGKKEHDEKMSPVSSYPELSEKYEGDYIALTPTEFSTIPLREIVEVVHDVPYTLKKKPQTPAGYPTISERYEGHYDHLQPHEFDRTPISDSVDEIHDVPYAAKKDDHSQYPQIGERYEGELDLLQANEVDGLPLRESVDQVHDVAYETEVHKTALIHAKTTDVEVIEDEENESPKTGKRKLFGFLSGKKEHHDEKMSPVSSYPELGERFEGVYEELNPTEFVTLPLRETVETVHDVPYSLKKEERSRYPPIGEKFEGEHDLLESKELDSSPLKEHVDRIHDIENLQPTKIEEVETHKTAVIHAKSTVVEVADEDERRKSSLFGFLRSAKKSPEHNRSFSPYSFTTEPFEGELSDLPKTDELSVVPLNQHVDILHDVPYKSSVHNPKLIVSEEQEEPKKIAQLLVKSEVIEVPESEVTPERKPLFGFLRGKKEQSSKSQTEASSAYPTTELWQGSVDLLTKPDEVIGSPLYEHVDQIHDISQPLPVDVKEDVTAPIEMESHKQTAVIHTKSTILQLPEETPKRPKKPKISGKKDVKKSPSSDYPSVDKRWEGELADAEKSNELVASPLREHVEQIHDSPYGPTKASEDQREIRPSTKPTAILHLTRREKPESETRSQVDEQQSIEGPSRKKAKRTSKVEEQQPSTSAVTQDDVDVGLTRKPVARLLLKSREEEREVQSKVRKPGTRGLMQRLFRKRRTPFDVRNAAVRAGKDESSELVAVMSIGDASFFTTESDVRNVEVNLFARRLATAAYHVEILIADLTTRTFPVLFDGRRGPMCLPISYMTSTADRVSFTTFGPSTSGGGLNANLSLEEREDEEADASSMASATIETDRSHKKHKRHHRSAPSDSTAANDGKPQSTDRKPQHLEQSQTSESDKKHKEKPKSKHDTSSSSNSSVEVEERHHILHGEGQTVLPLSSSPNKTDEFVEESETISSKVVTTGNRTVETITYTTIKDGVQHSRVEHRVTVNPSEVDSEAALKRAIAESTGLSSRYQVQGLSVPIHSNE
ncbi:Moesin/ezrin/radixin-like protein 1 [Aphelenchoides besseyi]|nr:Moesin/ezrin/radixin-like protein 1 [Aphelenchoides besseyi]